MSQHNDVPPKTSDGAESVDQSLPDLVLRAREGDVDAAYEVLGRQVAVDDWVAVVDQLARTSDVDLEQVAQRTLLRPPAVVASVLRLVRAASSPRAAFLARVIAETRHEERIRAEATLVRQELIARFDVEEQLAGGEFAGAVYALLARPLPEQAEIVSQLARDVNATEGLFEAARAEYTRLQDVARDTRWRSGSYRHALRHALADLALIGGVRGRFEDQAFRLLQQRTEQPAANAELLTLMAPELRRRYLEWSLDRSSAEASPARALFAIEQLEVYPDAVDPQALQRLLTCRETDVAVAAAVALLARCPSDSSYDRDIAELLHSLEHSAAAAVVTLIPETAPGRIRVDLWPSSLDPVVGTSVEGVSAAIGHLLRVLESASDETLRLRLLSLLSKCGESIAEREDVGRAIARSVVARPNGVSLTELEVLLDAQWLRCAIWQVADTVPPASRLECIQRLVPRDPADAVWRQLASLYARIDHESRPGLEDLALDVVESGHLAADDPPTEAEAFVDALGPGAAHRSAQAALRLQRARTLMQLGESAAQRELADALEPLVARAVERSTGNDRLVDDYRRLLSVASPDSHDVPGTEDVHEAALAALAQSLAGLGVELEANAGDIEASIAPDATTQQVIRAIAIVAQRHSRAPSGTEAGTMRSAFRAIAVEAARRGAAEQMLRDLVERGPLFHAAVSLSPEAGSDLVAAALGAGLAIPEEWRSHDVLGEWLAQPTEGMTRRNDVTSAEAPVNRLQVLQAELREAEHRLERGRAAARLAFVENAISALDDLEESADTFVQLWLGMKRLGIQQVAPLGQVLAAEELDPERHEIVGEVTASSYVVRAGGIQVDNAVVRRARVEAV